MDVSLRPSQPGAALWDDFVADPTNVAFEAEH